MTTKNQKRINAHAESPGLPAHEEEKRLEAHIETPVATAAADPVFANSRRGNTPAIMKWGIAVMLVLAAASAVAVIIGLNHHKSFAAGYDENIVLLTPGGSFVLEGSYAPQFLDARQKADYQPQAASTSTATAVSADGRTSLVAITDPSTRIVYLFEVDEASIPENATLNEFARSAANSDDDITVIAYTDPTGSAEHNLDLSKRRAQALGSYLRRHGIDAGRLNTVGKGATDAFGSNRLDRRAELHL